MMAAKVSMESMVDKVNKKKHQLTLKDDQGNKFKVNVPEGVGDLGKIKKGDKVAIQYFTSVAFELDKGKAGEQPTTSATTTIEGIPGAAPGGVMTKKISTTSEVMRVDKYANKLTLKHANGELDTIDVKDPDLHDDLAMLKKGDKIHASYTEAVAISLEPRAKSRAKGT
jgi:hypothetical protein